MIKYFIILVGFYNLISYNSNFNIRFWRNNGIAFSWLEGEPIRSNPTLLNNIMQYYSEYVHYTYSGDIINGPFFCWILQEEKDNNKMYF